MAANQYDLDYFRHVLKTVDSDQLSTADILAMLDLLRAAMAGRDKAERPALALTATLA